MARIAFGLCCAAALLIAGVVTVLFSLLESHLHGVAVRALLAGAFMVTVSVFWLAEDLLRLRARLPSKDEGLNRPVLEQQLSEGRNRPRYWSALLVNTRQCIGKVRQVWPRHR